MPAPSGVYGFATVLSPKVEYPVPSHYQSLSIATGPGYSTLRYRLGRSLTVAGGATTGQPVLERSPIVYPEMYDYRTHCHVMGTTQSGKSKFVEACCREHIESGNGFAVLDWHGTLYENLVDYLAYRQPDQQIILVNPSSGTSVVPWNPFRFEGGDPSAHASRLVILLAKLWGMENTNDTPNFRRIAQMLFTWLAVSGEPIQHAATLLEYGNRSIRNHALGVLNDQPRARQELQRLQLISAKEPTISALKEWEWNVGSTWNRLGKLLDSRALVRMMGLAGKPTLDIDAAVENNAILLVNLAGSGELDSESAATFAALLLGEFQRAALTHAGEEQPYFLYLDEFQNYFTSDAARLLDQTAKAGMRITLIHHHMGQFAGNEPLKAAIEMNAQIKAVFAGLPPDQAARYAQELFMGELNQEWVIRERTKFVTQHRREAYESWDEHNSFSEGEFSSSSTEGVTVHHGDRDVPELIELPDSPDTWGRDEKLGQLAERLMRLPAGCCYLKTPDGTEYHEVPFIDTYSQEPADKVEYQHTANTLAIPSAEADRIIKQQAESFLKRSLTDAGRTKTRPAKRPARLHAQE